MERCEPALLQTLREHTSDVSAADVTRAGAPVGGLLLCTGGAEGAVRVWRWAPALGFVGVAGVGRAHRLGVTALACGGAGVLLATCGGDGAARVWVLRGLRLVRDLPAGGGAVPRALCWAGPTLLATAQDDGVLVLWDVRGGSKLTQAEGADLAGVAALCGGRALVTVDAEGSLRAWGLPALDALCREGGAHEVGALCVAAEGTRVATGGHDARVRLWEWAGGRLEAGAVLGGHTSAVTCLRWARDGDTLGSGSLDRSARLWSASRAECLRVLDAHHRYVSALVFSPDDGLLVTGSNDRTARVWSLREGLTLDVSLEESCSALLHFGIGDLQGIEEIPDDVGGGADREESAAVAKEAEGFTARGVWAGRGGHAGAVNGIAAAGDLLATACSDRLVRVFRRDAGGEGLALRHALVGHRYPAMAVSFSPDGDRLVSAGLDGLVILWDVQSGGRVRTLSAELAGAACGGGGVRAVRAGEGCVLAGTDDGLLALWDLADPGPAPAHVYTEDEESVTCCAMGEVGGEAVLVAGGAGGELGAYRARPPRLLCRRRHAHDLGVQSCDAAPSADMPKALWIASCGCDSVARVWELRWSGGEAEAALRELRTLRGHGGTVTCCRLGEDALLATTATDMFARVWCVRSGACVACVRLAGAGGAACVWRDGLVAGTLGGDLSLWELPRRHPRGVSPGADAEPEWVAGEREAARWSPARVVHWLREHLPAAGDVKTVAGAVDELISRIEEIPIDGARLIEAPLRDLMADFGFELDEDLEEGKVETEREEDLGQGDACQWLLREVRWLRATPRLWALADSRRGSLPHALLCPLSHRALLEPLRCADGFTYDRAALHEALLAAESACSPVSGRPLAHTRGVPNVRARLLTRRALAALLAHPTAPSPAPPPEPALE